MRTFASLFSGFGGADIGAMQAGLKPIWGVEYDADIAGVAKTNGFDFMVADVREVDYTTLETPYWLHMSPVCKRASTANANAKEAVEDVETAQACVRAIEALRPPFISLENVRGYESFKAFHLIVRCLMDAGYNVGWWVLNSADYGGWTRCAIHANAVEKSWDRETAPDIVRASVTMPFAAQAQILAWDVVEKLARTTQLDSAVSAMLRRSGNNSVEPLGKTTLNGKADGLLTIEAMFRSALMGNTFGNIESLLKECLGDHFMKTRWYTTSTETKRITLSLICGCLIATENICPSTTLSVATTNDCPLCRFTGIPQTRERLCLIASRTERVRKPIQTHAKAPPHETQLSMFDTPTVKRWVGWYEAIEDLLPGLEDTKLAEWQWKFMPDEIKTMLIDGMKQVTGMTTRPPLDPANVVTASNWKHPIKAIVYPANRQEWNNNRPRGGEEPIYTVTASIGAKTALPKAVLFDGRNYRYGDITVLEDEKPSFTVTASNGVERYKAVLIDSANKNRNGKSTRFADEPALTALTQVRHKAPLCAEHRIVKLSSRCLARFQAFPDWYKLPDSNKLACTGIGNAKPVTLQQAEIEAQLVAQKAVA